MEAEKFEKGIEVEEFEDKITKYIDLLGNKYKDKQEEIDKIINLVHTKREEYIMAQIEETQKTNGLLAEIDFKRKQIVEESTKKFDEINEKYYKELEEILEQLNMFDKEQKEKQEEIKAPKKIDVVALAENPYFKDSLRSYLKSKNIELTEKEKNVLRMSSGILYVPVFNIMLEAKLGDEQELIEFVKNPDNASKFVMIGLHYEELLEKYDTPRNYIYKPGTGESYDDIYDYYDGRLSGNPIEEKEENEEENEFKEYYKEQEKLLREHKKEVLG